MSYGQAGQQQRCPEQLLHTRWVLWISRPAEQGNMPEVTVFLFYTRLKVPGDRRLTDPQGQ